MEKWLPKISGPADLRGLELDALCELAEEIRERMLKVTAINGGHLASSMGTVELAIALHYCLQTERDRLVWDVGHQAYPHKLLTGRADRFHTIRQYGGLSGFLKREESPYDHFGAGHASTAISAALGMALARDRRGEDYRVAAVVGDGAMTGGLCYEALNNAGGLKPRMLLVLNDNEMSISKNVGALSTYFNKIITTHFYNRTKRETRGWLRQMPAGERVHKMINRVEESVKGLILPGVFFEELGFRYIGPVDGHNLEELIETLTRIRDLEGPVVLHTITVKGKGRPYAEADPITWHSPPANFDAESGKAPTKKPGPPSWTNVFVDALCEAAHADENVVAITAAMLEGTGLVQFEEQFPERTYDVGIAEEHAVLTAAGMACEGLRPVVCIYSTFLQRAYDQIIHDVALQKLPVVFALDRAGLVGSDGPTHHGVFDLSYLRMIPNLTLMAPSNAWELTAMTQAATQWELQGPVAIRFPRGAAAGEVEPEQTPKPLEYGRGVVEREGDGICIVAAGLMVEYARRALDLLAPRGLRPGLINARFVKPLDAELICDAARRYERLVTIEDNVLAGGFGSAVSEVLAAAGLQTPVTHLGLPDAFVTHGSPAELYAECGLDAEGLTRSITELASAECSASHIQPAG